MQERKKKGHDLKNCRRKQNNKGGKKKSAEEEKLKRTRYPCGICDNWGHQTYKCPRKIDAQKCINEIDAKEKQDGDKMGMTQVLTRRTTLEFF